MKFSSRRTKPDETPIGLSKNKKELPKKSCI